MCSPSAQNKYIETRSHVIPASMESGLIIILTPIAPGMDATTAAATSMSKAGMRRAKPTMSKNP